MYHRQIFKLLLSSKVLDDPRQRRLFKPTDLVELFNLNEPIDGKSSESDHLFRESKLTPASGGFSLSKIEEMKKLASAISKKISASVKSTCENNSANNSTCKGKQQDEQNNNSRCIEILLTKNDISVDQTLSCNPISISKSSSKYNENSNTNLDADIERNSNVENKNTFNKNNQQTIITINSVSDNSTEEKNKSILNDDKITSHNTSSINKRKKHRRDSHLGKRNISAMFEGERVSCLIGRRLGYYNEKEESISTTDDNYVLRKLFTKSSNIFIFNISFLNLHMFNLKFYLIRCEHV